MSFENEFYEWAQKNLFLKRAQIEANETQKEAAAFVVDGLESGQIELCDKSINYKLNAPVGDIETVTCNLRLKTGKMQELNAAKESEKAYKLFEVCCNLPYAITKETDFKDFTNIARLFAFL